MKINFNTNFQQSSFSKIGRQFYLALADVMAKSRREQEFDYGLGTKSLKIFKKIKYFLFSKHKNFYLVAS